MSELYENQLFNFILLLTVIGEFFLPWILMHFYPGYNSKTMVMSALGNPESPVRNIYNIWLIWLGIFLLFTSFVIYPEIKQVSASLAVMTSLSIAVFAIGAGILAGIFSVNESKETVTVASKIHGIGSAIGFMTLLFFPLLSCITGFKTIFSYEGLWERLTLFFMYVPFLYMILENLANKY